MTDTDARVLEKVRKLLARAEHPATPPGEAEACSAKAAALMTRHLIDQAMLDAAQPRRADPVIRHIVVDPPYAVPKAVLLDAVAKSFAVRVVVTGEGEARRRCSLVGFPSDIEMAELLFTSLLLQASSAMLAASTGGPGIKAFRRSFLLAYASTIRTRLAAVRRETEHDAALATPGTAVVLADRHARVEAAFAEQFPHLRSLRATASSYGGVAAGHDAGQRADLSLRQPRVDGRRPAIGA